MAVHPNLQKNTETEFLYKMSGRNPYLSNRFFLDLDQL